MNQTNRNLRIFWSIILVLSLLYLGLNWGVLWQQAAEQQAAEQQTSSSEVKPGFSRDDVKPWDIDEAEKDPDRLLNIFVAVASAIVSGGGFLVTTYAAMRDEKRKETRHQLELKNLRRDIEQKELEIEKLRKEIGS